MIGAHANSSASLAGKYAIVTGGSRGIGAAIAVQLARKGAEAIAITYVGNKALAENVVAEIEAIGAKAIAIRADIESNDVGEVLIRDALRGLHTEHLDIIVNNAALLDDDVRQTFANMTTESFHRTFQGNVLAPVMIIRAALPHLPAHGGRIINISSVASKEATTDGLFAYGASKAALDSFTRGLANVFAAEKHCTINSLSVGATETQTTLDVLNTLPPAVTEMLMAKQTAAKRFATPEDIALIVGFLASEESRWINGANVPANGGSMLLLQG